MATPTINEIKQQILTEKANYESLNGLDSTSTTSIYGLWAFIVASIIWLQYQFFEIYQVETDEKIKAQKVYSLLWFRDKALQFRFGHPLVQDGYNLVYSDEGYTEEEIQNSLVINRAAVIELEITNRKFLFVKCAKEVDEALEKLSDAELAGLVDYFKRIKPAGTKLVAFSDKADDLRLTVDFFYDPLVFTEEGTRIDGRDNEPVQNAIREYLKNLRFNGEFSVAELEDILQSVPGCSDREAYIKSAEANFQTPEAFNVVNDVYIANSGYMSITDANLTINFIAKTVTN